jgi:hypothetical protein
VPKPWVAAATVERGVHTRRKIAHPVVPGSIGTIETLEHEAMR